MINITVNKRIYTYTKALLIEDNICQCRKPLLVRSHKLSMNQTGYNPLITQKTPQASFDLSTINTLILIDSICS